MAPLVHLALAQLKPRKGDYSGNLERLRAVFAQLDELSPRPMVLALAESALTGYFLEGGVRDNAVTAGTLAQDLDAAYRASVRAPKPLDVVVGFYEIWNNKLYNSSMYVTLGEGDADVRHVHRKVFLPTYGLFDEERFVERGREVRAFDTPWGRAAMLVCEDAWHSMTATIAALDGAQIIFVCAAPPSRGAWPKPDDVPGPASVSRWDRLIRDIADEHGVYVTLTSLVGSEGGKLFPGGSFIAGPKGDSRGRAPLWEDAILSATDRPRRRDPRPRRHAAHRRSRDDGSASARESRRRDERRADDALVRPSADRASSRRARRAAVARDRFRSCASVRRARKRPCRSRSTAR